jgi:hypothetical protein
MAPSADSPDSADALVAVVDGMLLSELIESLPLSRGSVFELIKALGITTQTGRAPGGKGRAAWLSSADANRLRDAAGAVNRKEAKISDFAQSLQTPRTLQTLATVAPSAESPESADTADTRQLLRRLEAAQKAMALGFPLSTAEVSWILGVRPGSQTTTRAGVKARRTARNVWRLQSADSPDSGDSDG